MYSLITVSKNGKGESSAIVDSANVDKALDALREEGLDFFVEPFESYEKAYDHRFNNDHKLFFAGVMVDPYVTERFLSGVIGGANELTARYLRHGYDLAVSAVFELIEKAEKSGAIVFRRIVVDRHIDSESGKELNFDTVVIKIDLDLLSEFDYENFKKKQHSAYGAQFVLFSTRLESEGNILHIESFIESAYEKKDSLVMSRPNFLNQDDSCLVDFSFNNPTFFRKMLGEQ